jgi:hypothetical protein
MVSPVILGLEPIAVFTHDYDSISPLRSWPPVPAGQLHQGEMLAIKLFGPLLEHIRSPGHLYFASWRDPDPTGYLEAELGAPPTAILFIAQFGVAPYATTPSLLETAEMFNRLDRAQLRLDLVRGDDGSFRLDALEVELNAPSSKTDRHFRSCWKGEEIKTLDLSLQFDYPESRLDPFRFHLRARLPRRYNRGAAIEREHVEFTASGGAMPLPRWVNY